MGTAWLSTHGQGKLTEEKRDALKGELLRDLAMRPGMQVGKAVEHEVDKFLESGRVSNTNLSRLERRVQARCSGALTARGNNGDAASAGCSVSEFSVGTQPQAPKSARVRTPSSQSHSVGPRMPKTPMPVVPEQKLLPDGPISKWSDVAKYSKALELQEEKDKHSTKRSHQQQMAKDLEVQMAMKKEQVKASKLEEQRVFEHQEAELERWKADQHMQQDEVRRRALQVEKERSMQNAENNRRKEEDRQQRALEESEMVDRAARELLQEKQMFTDRKVWSKTRQVQLLDGVQERKDREDAEKTTKIDEERRKVAEYRQMLEEQEIRNRQPRMPIRGENAVVRGPPGGRKGEDFYTEENVMKQLHAANEIADNEDQAKIKTSKDQKMQNQDFLFQQMVERNRNRDKAMEQKKNAKLQAQSATSEFLATERARIGEVGKKNVQYRVDLERQMASRRAALPGRGAEDLMSSHEKAINQHLIQEAEDLRVQLSP